MPYRRKQNYTSKDGICTRSKHCPIFRIGGDVFAAVLEGADYDNREDLLDAFEKQMDTNLT